MNIVQLIFENKLIISAKCSDFLIYLKTLSDKYSTVKELIDSKQPTQPE